MPLAEIQSVPMDDAQLSSWSFSHMAHHRDINRVLFTTRNIRIDEFVLDPLDPKNMESWLDQHQQAHNQQNQALGIAGYNPSEVDWENETSRSQWVWAHADEHNRAAAILGVS